MSCVVKKPFVGTFQPVKWSCRAPLPSGRLCPRMDRFKCPLHGKIVARDEHGQTQDTESTSTTTTNEPPTSSSSSVPAWQDAALIADINASSGGTLNVKVVGDKAASKRGGRGKKASTLTNVKKEATRTPRARLEKKILNRKQLRKIGSILDSIEQRQHAAKFHHNFNYAINE